MQNQEIDAQQCRILRQADEIFKQQITKFANAAIQEKNKLNVLRSEMSELVDELYKQETLRAPADGSTGEILASDISDKISILKNKISILETRISYSAAEVIRFQDKADLAANDAQNNVSKMKDLNCVV